MLILWIKRILLTVFLLYAIGVCMLVLFENYLVYPGSPPSRGDYGAEFDYEDVHFTASDGTKLHGWMIPYPESSRYVLYCHGNGENVAGAGNYFAKEMGAAMKANVFVFDYRGFGKSEGKSSEAGLKLDTDAAMNWLCERFGIKPTDVIVEGFSIGGGAAVYVAMNQGAKGLLLQRTFSSLPDVSADKFPWAPVRLLMRNKFDSAALIANYKGPLLQSHGAIDKVVPIKFGEKLHRACPSTDKQFFTRPDMNHYTSIEPEFLKMASQFADRLYSE